MNANIIRWGHFFRLSTVGGSLISQNKPAIVLFCYRPSTVGINPRLSDLKGPGTSKLDWRYLEHDKIDWNELQIRNNSQKGTGTKIAEKLNNFEKFERKKVKFQPCF